MNLISNRAAGPLALFAAALLALTSCRYDDTTTTRGTATSAGSETQPPPPATTSAAGATEHANDPPGAAAPLARGAAAPPFHLNAGRVSLDSRSTVARGPLVVVFYIGDFCIYCRRQLESLQRRIGDFTAAGATVWAISADDVGASTALARDLSLTFPLGSDPSLRAISAFGVASRGTATALPAVFVLEPDGAGGRVVFQQVGADQADRAAIDAILAAVRSISRDH